MNESRKKSTSLLPKRTSDWVCLSAISLTVTFCGVFGCSYVIGRGWPMLELWAEILLTVAITPLAALLLMLGNRGINRLATSVKPEGSSTIDRWIPHWNARSILLFSALMALMWTPWFIANFPGGTYWDTYYQIFQVYPENHPIAVIPWAEIYDKTLTDAWLVDHHPVFTTLVYGAFGWLSDQLTGNWMAGVALFCILQGLAHVVAFTASVAYLRRVGCPPSLALIAYLFFALMPFVSTWAMCMVKDSFFGLFYIPYFMMLFEIIRTKGQFAKRPRNIILFAFCALMLCLTKKTGLFVVIPTTIVGLIVYRKSREAVEAFLAHGLLPTIVMLVIFPLILFPALNIEPGGKQETLGPLFQQTARYIVDYGDEVTPEEKDAISAVLDYNKLRDQYNFDFEDSVKYRYALSSTSADIARYLEAYIQMGLKHPDSYFGAIMSLAGFYVAPTAYANIRMVTVDTKMGPSQRYMLWNPDELDWLRNGLDNAYKALGQTPVVDIPLLLVTYVFWLPALLVFVAFRNRLRSLVLFVPPLVLLAFCVIAPVYDARYAVPVFDGAPLFFCAIVVLLSQRKMISKGKANAAASGTPAPAPAPATAAPSPVHTSQSAQPITNPEEQNAAINSTMVPNVSTQHPTE